MSCDTTIQCIIRDQNYAIWVWHKCIVFALSLRTIFIILYATIQKLTWYSGSIVFINNIFRKHESQNILDYVLYKDFGIKFMYEGCFGLVLHHFFNIRIFYTNK